jgi:hypothetical protein
MITSVSRRNAPENVTRDLLCGRCAIFVCYVYAANLDCYKGYSQSPQAGLFHIQKLWKNQERARTIQRDRISQHLIDVGIIVHQTVVCTLHQQLQQPSDPFESLYLGGCEVDIMTGTLRLATPL